VKLQIEARAAMALLVASLGVPFTYWHLPETLYREEPLAERHHNRFSTPANTRVCLTEEKSICLTSDSGLAMH